MRTERGVFFSSVLWICVALTVAPYCSIRGEEKRGKKFLLSMHTLRIRIAARSRQRAQNSRNLLGKETDNLVETEPARFTSSFPIQSILK